MKRFLKTIAYLLTLTFILGTFACNVNRDDRSSPETPNPETTSKVYTDYSFVDSGRTDYKIVISSDAADNEKFAAEELQSFLKESFSVEFEVISDDGLTYTEDSCYVLLGINNITRELNAVPSFSELGNEGYIIKNYGKSIVICGANKTGWGTLYGTYEFLNRQIDFRIYADDEIVFTKSDSCKLIEIDLADKPDIEGRMIATGVYSNNLTFGKRMRVVNVYDVYANFITPFHNSFSYVPTSNKSAHPYWFSDKGTQLCYTAHGDEAEDELLQEKILNQMIAGVERDDSDSVNITLTIQDNTDICTCAACNEERQKYNAASGSVVKFCNDLSVKMKKYNEENNIKKEVNIFFFAYLGYESAPCNKDEEGNFVPTIYCEENVYPIICTINSLYEKAFSDRENIATYNNIIAWNICSKHANYWTYSTNFLNYTVPYDPFTCLKENYKLIASTHPYSLLDQGQSGQTGYATGFTMLKYWLNCQLAWDTDRDVDALTKEYFANYFKIASDEMYEYYLSYRVWLRFLQDEMGYQTKIFNALNAKYFPIGTLNSWDRMIRNALFKIEVLKETDEIEYNKLKKRIVCELITVDYLLIKLYGPMYSTETLDQMKEEFYKNCALAGVTMVKEGGSMENVF